MLKTGVISPGCSQSSVKAVTHLILFSPQGVHCWNLAASHGCLRGTRWLLQQLASITNYSNFAHHVFLMPGLRLIHFASDHRVGFVACHVSTTVNAMGVMPCSGKFPSSPLGEVTSPVNQLACQSFLWLNADLISLLAGWASERRWEEEWAANVHVSLLSFAALSGHVLRQASSQWGQAGGKREVVKLLVNPKRL